MVMLLTLNQDDEGSTPFGGTNFRPRGRAEHALVS